MMENGQVGSGSGLDLLTEGLERDGVYGAIDATPAIAIADVCSPTVSKFDESITHQIMYAFNNINDI